MDAKFDAVFTPACNTQMLDTVAELFGMRDVFRSDIGNAFRVNALEVEL